MPSITIRNIPEALYERLNALAKANDRSIDIELIACLEKGLVRTVSAGDQRIENARKIREEIGVRCFDAESIDNAKRTGRP